MKSKSVKTKAGSFPKFPVSKKLPAKAKKEWQVLCGDRNHYRVGFYCPPQSKNSQVKQLEKHDILEMFMLIKGSQTLILDDGKGEFELKLEPMKPVMVTGWHCGYSPKGPYAGVSIVVERDKFSTIYRRR